MTDAVPPTPPPGGTYTPPPAPPTVTPPGGASDRTMMLALSYIYFLGIIPLIVRKDDREVKWHALNGLLLFAGYIVLQVIWSVLSNFVLADMGCGIGIALSFVSCIIAIGYIVLFIMAIMKAMRGERMRFPVISELADKSA